VKCDIFLKKWSGSFCVDISLRVLNRLASDNTITKPIIDRYIIISKVSNSKEISRPDTAMAENDTIVPVIQNAAWRVLEKVLNT
jgi:hypothetical protein